MGNTEFKIFLGLELEKNAGTTLNQEITKLTKNGINLKVGLDESSLKTLTTAINGITQQLQKMGSLGAYAGKGVAQGFKQANEELAPQLVRLREITQEYKNGTRSAEEYAQTIKGMIFKKDGSLSKPAMKVPIQEMNEYISLLKQIQGTNGIEPIGALVSTKDMEVVKLGASELVRRVETYKDSLGNVQQITKIVGKETGELITSYQTLTSYDEKRELSLKTQATALEKYRSVVSEIDKFGIDMIKSGNATNADNGMIKKANEIKREYQELIKINSDNHIIDQARLETFKKMITEQKNLISAKDSEISKAKELANAQYEQERLVKKWQTSFDNQNTMFSTGVNEDDKKAMQDLINEYSKLDPLQENFKRRTNELADALSTYNQKVKETATSEQKQQVAMEKHSIAIQKLENAFKNTNKKYELGVDNLKSDGMKAQIEMFKELDPLSKTYAQDLERIRMELAQYTIDTRNNANEISNQVKNITKLNNLQQSLDNYTSKTQGFYDEAEEKSLRETLSTMREMIASGQDVSLMFGNITSRVRNFGTEATEAMKASQTALSKEQKLLLFKQKMMFDLNRLKEQYTSKGLDTSGIDATIEKVDKLGIETKEVDFEMKKLQESLRQMKAVASGVKSSSLFGNVVKTAAGLFSVYQMIGHTKRAVTSLVQEVTSLDDAMIGLTRVTDETTSTYEAFRQSAFKTVDEIGGSAKELVDSASEFAKLGYSFAEAQQLAIDATKYATAGEVSMEEATNALSASYTVFGGRVDEVTGKMIDSTAIIDLYNKIGNTMAVTSGDIGEAMKASANSLATANNSLSESVALIATANKTVQDSSKVGNALRTISMRIRGVSEDANELLPKMDEVINKGTNGKVNIMDGEDFKSTYQIMLEISEVWDELSDKQQAYLAENVAGKNRAEVFMAIMGNAEDLTYAMEMAEDSIGSVDEEMAIVMQSFQKRVDVMKNAWVSLGNTTLTSDFVKGIVDATTAVIKLADACGGLIPILGALGTAYAVLKFVPMISGTNRLAEALGLLIYSINDVSLAMGTLNTVMSFSIAGVAIAGIMGIGYALNYASKEAERTRERIAELKKEVSEASNNVASIRSLGQEFEKLSSKESLNTEESERLLEVQRQIKEIQPDIGGYYDEQGNFIITQVSTANELLKIQKDILKAKKEEALVETKKVVQSKLDAYDEEKKKLEDIAKEQEKVQRIESGTASLWDKLTYTDDSTKAVIHATSTNNALFKDTETRVKDSLEAIKDITKEAQEYILDELTLDDAWDKLGENTANGIRKKLSELSSDELIGYAKELHSGKRSTEDFIEVLKNMADTVEDTGKAFSTTGESDNMLSSLGVVAQETADNLDILKVAMAELDDSNDISEKTMEKLIKKYPELASKIKDVDSAYTVLNQKINENEFDKATQGMSDLTSILEDLEAGNGITASSFKKLTESFPELLAYMNDEASLTDAIKSKMNDLKNVQNDAYKQMLMNSESYYRENVKGNEQMTNSISKGITSLFNNLKVAYQGDMENWKTLAQGKAEVEEELINSLNKAWEEHFGTLRTQFSKMEGASIVEKGTFDREKYAKQNFLSEYNPNHKLEIDRAEKEFYAQEEAWMAEKAKQHKAMQDVAKIFDDIKFDPIDIKVGGSKASSKSGSSKKASYIASIFQEIVDEILRGGEEIETSMKEVEVKLNNAILMGDEATEQHLLAKMSNLQVALRDKQASMAKELDKQISEMGSVLSETGAFKAYDMAKLTAKDIAEVIQGIEKQINSATLSGKDSEVDRLNNLKSLINDVGSVYIDTIQDRRELSSRWWEEENTRLEKYAENLEKYYSKKFEALDREDKILELRKSMLLEDGDRYDKEEKEADKILELNQKLFSNIVKKRELCESQIAQLRAKGFNDESEEIQALIDKWLDYEQARIDMIKEIAEARRQNEIDSANRELSDITEAKDQMKSLIDLTIDMLKKETEAKKDALKEQNDAKKEALKEEYEAEKKALQDKLKLVKDEADAKKSKLDKEKRDRDYEDNVAEKQKEIATLRQQILELSNDDSASSVKKRKELEAELDKYLKELEKMQEDRSTELQKEAIDEELKAQEDKINKELEGLEEQYDKESELLEEKYKDQLKEYEDYLKNQQQLKEEASKLIESRDKAFYERLKSYALDYTDTTQAEFEDCWNKAYEALDKYGSKQLDVIDVIELMTQKVIDLNAELKRLNDTTYKDFIQDDSSTSNDDFGFAGDKDSGSSNDKYNGLTDKKAKEEFRDKQLQKMIDLGNQMDATPKSETETIKKLKDQQKEIAKTIGAYLQGDTWYIMIDDKKYRVRDAVGVRHTGLKTGEVGAPWGSFKVKSNEELNKLKNGEIVLNDKDTSAIMQNVKTLAQNSSTDSLQVVIDMHDFNVTEDALPKFEKLLKNRVPKIINDALFSKGIK